jgi:magnesium transporter
MTEYTLNPSGAIVPAKSGAEPILVTMPTDEFREKKGDFAFHKDMLHSLGSIRYCKAELYKDRIIGTLRVPRKEAQRAPELSFGFCLTAGTLYIIEDKGEYKTLISRLIKHSSGVERPSQLLLRLLELLTENDVPYMMHIEAELERMEDELSGKTPDDFFRRLTRHRQKLSELGAYYGQLSDIGERLSDEVCAPVVHDCTAWEKFARRAERLQDHAELVAESALQLRELYQSEQDSRQNRIMGLLTVVTTLFLPLTLLTGWYGMNFRNMPELTWRCGYAVAAAVALVIVVIEILWLRKHFRKF